MRVVSLLVLMASACAGTVPSPLTLTPQSDSLCWWRDARWFDTGELRDEKLGATLGRGHEGARFSGALRQAGEATALVGRWSGEGLTLRALVDLRADAALHSFASVKLNAVGALLAGAPVHVADARLGEVLATPPAGAFDFITLEAGAGAVIRCEDLTLVPRIDEAPAQLTSAGFPGDARTVQLEGGESVPFSATPGGAAVGTLSADAAPLFELSRDGEFARLALPTRAGVLWVGYVPASVVQPAAPLPASGRPPPADAGRGDDAEPLRVCDRALEVAVERAGETLTVGELSSGTPFLVRGEGADHAAVHLAVNWFVPAEGVTVLLPSFAAQCPETSPLTHD